MGVLLFTLTLCVVLIPSTLCRSHHHQKHSVYTPPKNVNISCESDYSCLDCTTARVCAPTSDGQGLYEIQRFKCDSYQPYCNFTTGTCSSIVDPACYNLPNVTVSNNFTCMRNGFFPDPYNCSIYYHCQDEVAYQYACVSPYPYYLVEYNSCVSYSYYCANLTAANCRSYYAGTKLGFGYPGYNYYIYCGLNRTVTTVDKCIGAYTFSYNYQECIPTCPHAGLFPKDDDCANYYKCSPKTSLYYNDFNMTDLTCPEGQGFSETEYMCVDRSRVPNCQKPYPALYSK
ncbi:uncharacterized protein LOC128992302 [Macrosteles quadrilineatus]|uniref:uncharacterized protein LOC128992302 n=1 Tax=Macrosteles quadrilineatus TaxID=74068 RepID=UPI0023E30070|nr:uncharacterized protein LOC128992302 [Macrosteles quadrilineatus]